MKRIYLVISAVFVFCCVHGVGWGQESFMVEGMIEKSTDVPSPTAEMALKDGLTKAVQEAVRGMVTPQIMEKRTEDLAKGIYSRAESFISGYKVLEKTPLPTGYKVLLEVLVDTEGITRSLETLGILTGGQRRPTQRTVELVVAGINNYQVFLAVEKLLREDAGVQMFTLSEIEPAIFTWRIDLREETNTLVGKLHQREFSGHMGRVVTVTPVRIKMELSN